MNHIKMIWQFVLKLERHDNFGKIFDSHIFMFSHLLGCTYFVVYNALEIVKKHTYNESNIYIYIYMYVYIF